MLDDFAQVVGHALQLRVQCFGQLWGERGFKQCYNTRGRSSGSHLSHSNWTSYLNLPDEVWTVLNLWTVRRMNSTDFTPNNTISKHHISTLYPSSPRFTLNLFAIWIITGVYLSIIQLLLRFPASYFGHPECNSGTYLVSSLPLWVWRRRRSQRGLERPQQVLQLRLLPLDEVKLVLKPLKKCRLVRV